jgi:hypothetical protein
MILWILIAWMCLSFVAALAVGRFIAWSHRGCIAYTAQCSENSSMLLDDSYTIQLQAGETVNEASAL